jgi:hypothetical protein
MQNLNDILDLSFCQAFKYLEWETTRCFARALLVSSLGIAIANTFLCQKWQSIIVLSSFKK